MAVIVLWTSVSEPHEGPWAAYDLAVKQMAASEGTSSRRRGCGESSSSGGGNSTANAADSPYPIACASAVAVADVVVKDDKVHQNSGIRGGIGLSPLPEPEWEAHLAQAGFGVPGVELLEDILTSHEIEWPSPEMCWKVSHTGIYSAVLP